MPNYPNNLKAKDKFYPQQFVVKVLVISILISAITGGIFGTLAGAGRLGKWFQKALIDQNTNQGGIQNVNFSTLTVEENSKTVEVVEKVSPAVVSIVVTQDFSKYYEKGSPFDLFFGTPFSYPQGKQRVGAGSGFIISSDGLILTNKHVVSNSDAEYTVVLNDGNTYDAQVLALDPSNDLAILKVETQNLPVVELGDSDSIKIGQTVIAIGNALGEYRNTVTKGIVSGLARTVTAGDQRGALETIENTIQTDAAINPGNSGGPLINLAGQVIGINTAISQEGQLIGFAIPINEAKRDIESVKKYGRIIRPFLGVRYVLINKKIQEANNLSVDYGALIVRGNSPEELAVVPGSPADQVGLEENDIILEINGEQINQNNSLTRVLAKYNPGDEVSLKILHDGKEKTVKVTLSERE